VKAGWYLGIPLLCLLFSSFSRTQEQSRDNEIAFSLVDIGEHVYDMNASFLVKTSPQQVWEVLTDYANVPNFVTAISESTLGKRTKDETLLSQTMKVKVLYIFPVYKKINLSLQEIPNEAIHFHETDQYEFQEFKGHWKMTRQAGDTLVSYHVRMKPYPTFFEFLLNKVSHELAKEMLQGVKDEIERRSTKTSVLSPAPASSPTLRQ
jgi:ribosome-associated toxin RatA of RatAB toxin-antitoxin module